MRSGLPLPAICAATCVTFAVNSVADAQTKGKDNIKVDLKIKGETKTGATETRKLGAKGIKKLDEIGTNKFKLSKSFKLEPVDKFKLPKMKVKGEGILKTVPTKTGKVTKPLGRKDLSFFEVKKGKPKKEAKFALDQVPMDVTFDMEHGQPLLPGILVTLEEPQGLRPEPPLDLGGLSATYVPEPMTAMTVGVGLLGLLAATRRRSASSKTVDANAG